MVWSMTHDDAREFLGLYALGALEPGDAEALAGHLARCPSCCDEAADLRRAAAELVHAVPSLAPSAEVTRRILDGVTPARSPPTVGSRGGAPSALQRPLRRRRLLLLGAGLSIAATVAGLVVSQWMLRARLDRALSTIARGRDLLQFIASPDVRTVTLASEYFPDARAFVSCDPSSGRLVVVAFEVPPPPDGQVYQLWAISDGIRPAAVFSPDALGGALVRHRWSPEHVGAPLFAITLEPAPGGPEPTGTILFISTPPGARGAGHRGS